MDNVYHTDIPLPTYEIDFANRLRLSAYFRFFQDVASAHATGLGLGYEALTGAGLFWVLSWARLEVERCPGFGETMRVTTWPKQRHRLFSIRDFLFEDEKGSPVARAATAWLLVDAGARRAVPLERLPRSIPYHGEESALSALPGRLPEIGPAETISVRNVTYSDLDLLGHVNNARYVEFLLDAYPQEFHRSHWPRAITLTFRNEARYGDRLEIRRLVMPDDERAHRLEACEEGSAPLYQAAPTHQAVPTSQAGKTVIQAVIEWA